MSKLSEFTDHLATVKEGQQATLSHEGCQWLIGEITRLQNVAKQALLDQRAAEQSLRQVNYINSINIHAQRGEDEEK